MALIDEQQNDAAIKVDYSNWITQDQTYGLAVSVCMCPGKSRLFII